MTNVKTMFFVRERVLHRPSVQAADGFHDGETETVASRITGAEPLEERGGIEWGVVFGGIADSQAGVLYAYVNGAVRRAVAYGVDHEVLQETFQEGCVCPYSGLPVCSAVNHIHGYAVLQQTKQGQQRGSNDIRSWHLSRAENMDVYLHRRVTVVENDKVPTADTKPYLLLTPIRYLKYFPDRETYTVGTYAIVL